LLNPQILLYQIKPCLSIITDELIIQLVVFSDITPQNLMATESCAERRKLHIISVKESEVFVVALWNRELITFEIGVNHFVKNRRVKAAVIDVPAHSVIKIFSLLFSFKETNCMIHKKIAEPEREEHYKEIRNRALKSAAVINLAFVPFV